LETIAERWISLEKSLNEEKDFRTFSSWKPEFSKIWYIFDSVVKHNLADAFKGTGRTQIFEEPNDFLTKNLLLIIKGMIIPEKMVVELSYGLPSLDQALKYLRDPENIGVVWDPIDVIGIILPGYILHVDEIMRDGGMVDLEEKLAPSSSFSSSRSNDVKITSKTVPLTEFQIDELQILQRHLSNLNDLMIRFSLFVNYQRDVHKTYPLDALDPENNQQNGNDNEENMDTSELDELERSILIMDDNDQEQSGEEPEEETEPELPEDEEETFSGHYHIYTVFPPTMNALTSKVANLIYKA